LIDIGSSDDLNKMSCETGSIDIQYGDYNMTSSMKSYRMSPIFRSIKLD